MDMDMDMEMMMEIMMGDGHDDGNDYGNDYGNDDDGDGGGDGDGVMVMVIDGDGDVEYWIGAALGRVVLLLSYHEKPPKCQFNREAIRTNNTRHTSRACARICVALFTQ